MNASYKGICVKFVRNTSQRWFSYFQIACKYLQQSFITDPLNIIFDDFDIWLLGYRIEFSYLYIPQGHYFKYFVAMK